jgi:hypothetical protein
MVAGRRVMMATSFGVYAIGILAATRKESRVGTPARDRDHRQDVLQRA